MSLILIRYCCAHTLSLNHLQPYFRSFNNSFNKYSLIQVYDDKVTQEEVFHSVKDLIDESLKGFNVAIFAFGMTGSGKTHTISGTSHMPGIVPRTVYHVFSDLRLKAQQSKDSIGTILLMCILTLSLTYLLTRSQQWFSLHM